MRAAQTLPSSWPGKAGRHVDGSHNASPAPRVTDCSDVALIILAGHRCLHAVVEDLDRHPVDRGKSCHVGTQQGLQILMQTEGATMCWNDRAPSRRARMIW